MQGAAYHIARRRRLIRHIMYSILPLLIYFLSFTNAQSPPAWDQQVDHLRGDLVPWNARILGEFYKDIRVVSGVSLRGRVVFTWKLPRDLKRGCLSVGYDLEVMNATQLVTLDARRAAHGAVPLPCSILIASRR